MWFFHSSGLRLQKTFQILYAPTPNNLLQDTSLAEELQHTISVPSIFILSHLYILVHSEQKYCSCAELIIIWQISTTHLTEDLQTYSSISFISINIIFCFHWPVSLLFLTVFRLFYCFRHLKISCPEWFWELPPSIFITMVCKF